MKTIAIVQARMGSTRLPDKVMRQIGGVPMIEILLSRLALSKEIDQIVLATTTQPENNPLAAHVKALGYSVYRGSENDVLDRYYKAAKLEAPDVVVRITGDCPLIDAEIVDATISRFKAENVDYTSNTAPPTYPDGLDTEVFSFSALERAWNEATAPDEREHVTPFISGSGTFSIANIVSDENFSTERWTVDEPDDLHVIRAIFAHFSPRTDFSWTEVINLRATEPELFSANQHIARNEGCIMGTGQKLWKRAKKIIPGGNMLLSKRAEMFLPDQWPAYYSKAKGCKLWDLDGREYIDMSIMGIGTNILGYGHEEVDDAVRLAVQNGNMSTWNCPEEVYLAEKLVELHPFADMVRLARSGGEANAIAIRIARAASGRDKVAICGYHGWHDWYLSANISSGKNLDGHLLPGLDPAGVPKDLQGTVLPFNYNNFEELEALVNANDIGTIKMEVQRSEEPKDGFLQKVRDLATRKNIILIFDECTSGFRETNGGLHNKYGVEPDMAVFGKAMGNGYAITAIIGKREIMEGAQSTFISSTFWTERIGPSAALKTLEVMEKEESWKTITNTGLNIRKQWQQLADKYEIKLDHWGLPALTGFTIKSPNALAYKTLITQEMLAKGYLASTGLYVSTEHKPDVVEAYIDALDPVFKLIGECEDGRDPMTLLNGEVCHSGFKRLN